MRFAVALCVTVLVACYHSADAGGQAPVPRLNSGQLRKSPSFNQLSKSRLAPGSPRRDSRLNLPITAQGPLPANAEPVPLPIEAIKKLGKYNQNDIVQAHERFNDMTSDSLEEGLIHTDLFADILRRARKNIVKHPEWTQDQRKDYLRKKVAEQLSLIERTYGKEMSERLLIRAMLDKGY